MRQQLWARPMTDIGLEHLFAGLEPILTPEEVADLLRVNKAAIYRWLNEKYLPGHKIGNNWRILREDLQEWMRQHSNLGPGLVLDDPAIQLGDDIQETPDP